jgi:hypothetical protein
MSFIELGNHVLWVHCIVKGACRKVTFFFLMRYKKSGRRRKVLQYKYRNATVQTETYEIPYNTSKLHTRFCDTGVAVQPPKERPVNPLPSDKPAVMNLSNLHNVSLGRGCCIVLRPQYYYEVTDT